MREKSLEDMSLAEIVLSMYIEASSELFSRYNKNIKAGYDTN